MKIPVMNPVEYTTLIVVFAESTCWAVFQHMLSFFRNMSLQQRFQFFNIEIGKEIMYIVLTVLGFKEPTVAFD